MYVYYKDLKLNVLLDLKQYFLQKSKKKKKSQTPVCKTYSQAQDMHSIRGNQNPTKMETNTLYWLIYRREKLDGHASALLQPWHDKSADVCQKL